MSPSNQAQPDEDARTLGRIDAILPSARRGDEGACTELVALLYPTVATVVQNHLPVSEAHEDITQEVFIKVFLKLDQFRGDHPLPHWVSKIALNTCIDRLRSQRTRRVRSYGDLGTEESAFFERTTSDEAHRAAHTPRESTTDLLDQLIATLTPQEQTVIRLIDLAEKSVAETCDLTGWGESKVKVTAMRARRKLSSALAELEADAPSASTA